MPKKKIHHVVVEIECLDSQTNKEAQERVHRWLETYGFTSPGHGFDFLGTKRLLCFEEKAKQGEK